MKAPFFTPAAVALTAMVFARTVLGASLPPTRLGSDAAADDALLAQAPAAKPSPAVSGTSPAAVPSDQDHDLETGLGAGTAIGFGLGGMTFLWLQQRRVNKLVELLHENISELKTLREWLRSNDGPANAAARLDMRRRMIRVKEVVASLSETLHVMRQPGHVEPQFLTILNADGSPLSVEEFGSLVKHPRMLYCLAVTLLLDRKVGEKDEIPKDEWDTEITACAQTVQSVTAVKFTPAEIESWRLKRDVIELKAVAAPDPHDAAELHDVAGPHDTHGAQNNGHTQETQQEHHFSTGAGDGSGSRMLNRMAGAIRPMWRGRAPADAEARREFAMRAAMVAGGAPAAQQRQKQQQHHKSAVDWKNGVWQNVRQAWMGRSQQQQQRGATERGVPGGSLRGGLGAFSMPRVPH